MGDTKLERVLPKNQHTQRKLLNFEFSINAKLSKSAKISLSKSIFYVKNHPNLSQFCFHQIILIYEHIFCYRHFLITSILKSLIKMMPNFQQFDINSILKIQLFRLGMLIFRQKSFQFCIRFLKNSITCITILYSVL